MAPENPNKHHEDAPELKSIWHIPEDVLFDMNQFERDRIFDERSNRTYNAINALVDGLPLSKRREIKPRIDRILSPELFSDDDDIDVEP